MMKNRTINNMVSEIRSNINGGSGTFLVGQIFNGNYIAK